MTVRGKMLLAFNALTIGICLIISGIGILIAQDSLNEEITGSTKEIAIARSAELGRWIEGIKASAGEIFKNEIFRHEKDRTKIKEFLVEHGKEMPAYVELLLQIQPDGSGIGNEGDDYDSSQRQYFKNIHQGSDFEISEAVISMATGRPIFVMAWAIRDENRNLLNICGVTVRLDTMTEIANSVKVGASGYGWAIDGQGFVLAHPEEDVRLKLNLLESDKVGFKGLNEAGREMVAGKTGVQEITRADGGIEMLFYAPIPDTQGWSFGVSIPKNQIMAPVYRLLRGFVLAASIMILITFLIVWLIAAGIARGVLRHTRAMLENSEYVGSSSDQLSQASQGLASGSSEQAASIEEISASIEEISGMTRQNADNANQADKLTNATIETIGRAHLATQKSLTASQEIARASGETQNIIKTIDEIAFQTNLLSLNAAVEAARAGEAGAGFAVVADEVRSLSMRSAEASRRTAELIEETISKVTEGMKIFEESGRAIDEVVDQSSKVQQLVSEIAAASDEQSKGIGEINRAVIEMEKVVQQVAASSEETASSSEELSAQAEEMRATVRRLDEFVGGSKSQEIKRVVQKPQRAASQEGGPTKVRPNPVGQKSPQAVPEQIIPLDENDFLDF